MTSKLLRALPLVALLVAACGLLDADAPAITGTWLAQDGSDGWRMELADPGTGTVSGSYLISDPSVGSLSFSGPVSGRYDFPAVSLDYSFVFDVFVVSCAIRGTMAASGQSIAATVTCSGLGESSSDAVDFHRTDG